MERYDVIIVGAGSAGVPLAARLSENPDRKVLLLDAGPHFRTLDEYPLELRHGGLQGAMDPGHPNNWAFEGELTTQGARQIVPRGKVVGGGSAVNGTIFERGLPEDFNEWAESGNDQWAFDKVLPFFKKLETDLDHGTEWHGMDGPIQVRRHKPDEFVPTDHAFLEACQEAGFPADPDMNSPKSYGVGALAVNNVRGIRMNTAHRYLEPISGERPNLTVRGECYARRVTFSGREAMGVEVDYNGERTVIQGDEIVLSSGAIKSAHLLMLSGVGPAAELKRFEIPVICDIPYVGKRFTDHVQGTTIQYRLRKQIKVDPTQHSGVHVGMHYTAEGSPFHSDLFSLATSIPHNVQLLYKRSLLGKAMMGLKMMRTMSIKRVLEEARFGQGMGLAVALMKNNSRGEITLTSADPYDKPRIESHYLEDPFDLQRLRYGARLMVSLVESQPFQRLGVERLSPTDEELASDAALDQHLQQHVFTYFHMAGTCRMGPDRDETAVVDQYCRVKGIRNLRVVDTSIWPEAVRRCTNATAVMTGERAAELFD